MSAVPKSALVYGYVVPGASGKMVLRLTRVGDPPAGTLASLVLRGFLPEGMTTDLDIVSDASLAGLAGPVGPSGWTPVLAGEADGTRTVLRVVDWTGGKGDKPALGYIGDAAAAGLVTKAAAFNFNAIKRVDIFTGTTAAGGVATIAFDPPFASTPAKALPIGVPNLLAGPVTAVIVAGTLTRAGVQVKVTSQALVGGLVTALVGASVSVIVIEA